MNWLQLLQRKTVALPLLVLALGIALSIGTAREVARSTHEDQQHRFTESVDRIEAEVQRRFMVPLRGMNSTMGLYAAHAQTSRAEFQAYFAVRDIKRDYPGVRGFGFIQHVRRDALERFVAAERADGAADFNIQPLQRQDHDDLYVVKLFEPQVHILRIRGLDVGGEERRREAIESAIASGRATLTAPVALIRDGPAKSGFLLFLPVYRAGTVLNDATHRRAALTGVLYASLMAGELLDGSRAIGEGLVDFDLMTAAFSGGPPTLVYGDRGLASGGSTDAAAPRFRIERTVEIAGRQFGLRAQSSPVLNLAESWQLPQRTLFAGSLLSVALSALTFVLLGRRERAEREARRMTRDLAAAQRDGEALLGTIRTHAIVSVADRDGRIIEVNDAFCRISGYRREELLGQDHRIVSAGVEPAAFWQAMWETIAAGRPWRALVCNRAKDGTLYWLDSIVAPYRGADGAIEKYVSVRTDITESIRAAKKIEDQQQRLNNILEGTNVGTWEWNVQTDVILFNERWAGILGYTLAEIGDAPKAWVHFHPDDRARSSLLLERHFAGELPHYEIEARMRHKDGRWVWVLDRGKLMSRTADGKPEWMYGTHTDITERKLAEQQARDYRDRFELAVDSAGIGVWEYEFAPNLVHWDGWMHRHFGTDPAGPAPTIKHWTATLHADDRERIKGEVLEAVAGSREFNSQFRIRWPDGQLRHLRAAGRVVREASGQPVRMAGVAYDVTEQRRAEESLKEGRAFLDNAGRIAGVGGWRVEFETGEIHWSSQTCRIHGVAPGFRPTMDEALGFYPPEARDEIQCLLAEAIASGEGYDVELPLVTKMGRKIWVRNTGEAEFEDGKAVRVVGACQDVTARRALEAKLRRSHELQASILEHLPCGVSAFNAELELVASNRQFRTLLDFPDAMFDSERPSFESFTRLNARRGEYGDGDVDALAQQAVERARGSVVPHHFERVRPNGVPLEVRGAPMPGGGFVTTYVDISQRKQAEARLQRSEALLRGAIETIDEAFVLFDPEDRLVLCNEKYREAYSLSRHLIVEGKPFEDLIREGAQLGQYLDATGRVDEWVAERLAAHRGGHSTLVQHLENGRVVRIVERRMPDGHVVGFRIDITSLVRATEAAEAASQAKSQFLAHMSHEIRTPLNAVLGMLALLRRTEQTSRQLDYTTKSEGAARSLLALLNDILDFSKIEAGRMGLEVRPFRVDEMLRDLSVILSANNEQKAIEVVFDIDPALPQQLVGDSLRLQQILINLGANALKFTERGEVVLSIAVVERLQGEVTLDIAVRDTGIGISAENQGRIFHAFTQAEDSTTRRFGGTGLGLAISQRLAGMMDSELKLDSELGKGSRFHFRLTLPVADFTADRQPALPASTPRLAGLRVLVAEDNANNQQTVRELLEYEGALVSIAANGLLAVAAVAAAEPAFDVVLMDLQMPEMDGLAAASRIRQDLGLLDLPVVAMTANVMASDREACLAAGMTDHVGKPFDIDHLVALLQRLTGRAGATSPARARSTGPATDAALQRAADAAQVDLRTALARLGGNRRAYQRLLTGFVADLAAMPAQLALRRRGGEWRAAARDMHSLKGLAATLGADTLARAAERVEGRLNDPALHHEAGTALAEIARVVEADHARLQILQGAVNSAFASDPGEGPATADAAHPGAGDAALAPALTALARLLAAADLGALAALECLRKPLSAASPEAFIALDEAVGGLDFGRALAQCTALIAKCGA